MPRGIYPRTEFHRNIISKSKKGTKYSLEARARMNKSKIGVPRSEVTRMKISRANIGKAITLETKIKMSLARKGKKLKPFTLNHRFNMSKAKRGNLTHLWKGGKTALVKNIRNMFEYKNWRREVYQRDKYRCLFCGVNCDDLNADHIKPFSLILDEFNIDSVDKAILCKELWDITNGRTLCHDCHKETQTYGVNRKVNAT